MQEHYKDVKWTSLSTNAEKNIQREDNKELNKQHLLNQENVVEKKEEPALDYNKKNVDATVLKQFNVMLTVLKNINMKEVELLRSEKGDHEAAANQLYDAIDNIKTLKLTFDLQKRAKKIGTAKDVDTSDIIEAIVRLSECANAYYDTHRGKHYGEKNKRKQVAKEFMLVSEAFLANVNISMGKPKNMPPEPNVEELKRKYKATKGVDSRLIELADIYEKWAATFGEEEGGERQRIQKKRNLFKPFENDIKLYRAQYSNGKGKASIMKIIQIYDDYKMKDDMLKRLEKDEDIKKKLSDPVMDYLKEKEALENERDKEIGLSDEQMDATLKEEQIKGIYECDRWFLKNFDNKGIFGRLVGTKNHHEEIISKLMSMSKRERLFMYYLIETGQRKSPQMYDVFASQINYKPNVDLLEKKMKAIFLKLTRRVNGDYINMYKLSEVMQISRDYKELLATTSTIEEDVEKAKQRREAQETAEENGESAVTTEEERVHVLVEDRKNLLAEFMLANITYKECLEQKLNNKDKNKKQELQNKLDAAGKRCVLVRKELFNADDQLKNIQDNSDEYNASLKSSNAKQGGSTSWKKFHDYSKTAIKYTKDANKYSSKAINSYGLSWGLSETSLKTYKYASGGVGDSLTVVSTAITTIGSIMNLVKNADNMHMGDVISSIVSITNSAEGGVISGLKLYVMAKDIVTGFEHVQASGILKTAGTATAGIALGINAYKVVTGALDMRNATNAEEALKNKKQNKQGTINNLETKKDRTADEEAQLKKLKREQKYDESMVKLAKKISELKLDVAMANTVINGLTLMTSFVPGGGQVGAAIILFAASLAISVAEAKRLRGIKKELFDDFMDMKKVSETSQKLMGDRSRKIYNQEKYNENLRLKMAAVAGYADTNSAADQICKKFGQYVYAKLFGDAGSGGAENDEEKNGYIQLVKALGLPYDANKKIPDEAVIARKFAGK